MNTYSFEFFIQTEQIYIEFVDIRAASLRLALRKAMLKLYKNYGYTPDKFEIKSWGHKEF